MYTTTDVALALGAGTKTIDNLVTRHCRHAIPAGTQGASRSIPAGVVELIALALLLKRDLGMPFRRGWLLATELLSADTHRASVGTLGTLAYDVPRLRAVIRQALADTIQDRPFTRRGRPPTKSKRGAPS